MRTYPHCFVPLIDYVILRSLSTVEGNGSMRFVSLKTTSITAMPFTFWDPINATTPPTSGISSISNISGTRVFCVWEWHRSSPSIRFEWSRMHSISVRHQKQSFPSHTTPLRWILDPSYSTSMFAFTYLFTLGIDSRATAGFLHLFVFDKGFRFLVV